MIRSSHCLCTYKFTDIGILIRKIVISSVSFLLPPTVFDDPRTIRCYIGNRKEIILWIRIIPSDHCHNMINYSRIWFSNRITICSCVRIYITFLHIKHNGYCMVIQQHFFHTFLTVFGNRCIFQICCRIISLTFRNLYSQIILMRRIRRKWYIGLCGHSRPCTEINRRQVIITSYHMIISQYIILIIRGISKRIILSVGEKIW